MITVREVEDSDLTPLAEFLPQGFPLTTKEYWIRQFDIWWRSNPACSPQIPRGWVLDNGSSLVGFIGNIPVQFQVNGTVKTAAASNSWYVDPSVRGIYSLRLFNEYIRQTASSLLLFKEEDDENLMKILLKYKFTEYILPPTRTEYVYLIDKTKVEFVITRFLFTRRLPKMHELPEFFKRLWVFMCAYLYQKPVHQRDVSAEQKYTSSLCNFCDQEHSRIWEPYQHSCDASLCRDTKTLNWLYFSPGRYYQRLVIHCHSTRDATLSGYMVFDILRKKDSDTGSMNLVDICIKDNNPLVLASLTSFAIEIGKQNNAALLVVCAENQETESYFQDVFSMKKTAYYYRYFRFSDPSVNSGNAGHVCLPVIYPPQ